MPTHLLIPTLLAAPACLAGLAVLPRSLRGVLRVCMAGTLLLTLPAALLAWHVFTAGAVSTAHGWLRVDALSAWHLVVMNVVFALSAIYAALYFGTGDAAHAILSPRKARRFASLWFGTYAAMALILTSNNLGTMWIGVEATTLLTAFLICIPLTPASLEAMWKYLVMCSVGVALAFAGVLLVAASAEGAGLAGAETLQWSVLMGSAAGLNPVLVKLGFVFLVVGFGVKAGLAPMHNWLPDAHGQAPAPVSGLFSGFLLNAALYAILRVLPLAESVTGNAGWARGILVALGLLSVLVSAAFILAQTDVKRLLAYCSVEHIGIVALGAGLGGLGSFAALFHILNHSLAKVLAFHCAGGLGRVYGTLDMRRMTGALRVSPTWGFGLVVSFLALIGMAPFAPFLSEWLTLKAAWQAGAWLPMGLFLFGTIVIFAGISRHLINMAWDTSAGEPAPPAGTAAGLLVALPSAALLLLGVWMPDPLREMITRAARVLGGVL